MDACLTRESAFSLAAWVKVLNERTGFFGFAPPTPPLVIQVLALDDRAAPPGFGARPTDLHSDAAGWLPFTDGSWGS